MRHKGWLALRTVRWLFRVGLRGSPFPLPTLKEIEPQPEALPKLYDGVDTGRKAPHVNRTGLWLRVAFLH